MKGIVSHLFGSYPDLNSLKRGVLIVSCSDALGRRVMQRLTEWIPHTQWQIVKREEPTIEGYEASTHYTLHSRTLGEQWSFIRRLREHRYDLAVVVWGNEEGYRTLKWLPLFLGVRAVLVFNENIDAFYCIGRNYRVLWQHWRWRRTSRTSRSVSGRLAERLLQMICAPLGLLYVVVRTAYLETRRMIRTH